MKKIVLILSSLTALLFSGSLLATAGDDHKMTIDHKGRVISIDAAAWPAHQRHGDTEVGSCTPEVSLGGASEGRTTVTATLCSDEQIDALINTPTNLVVDGVEIVGCTVLSVSGSTEVEETFTVVVQNCGTLEPQ